MLGRSLISDDSLWYASGWYFDYVRLGISLLIRKDGLTFANTGLGSPTI